MVSLKSEKWPPSKFGLLGDRFWIRCLYRLYRLFRLFRLVSPVSFVFFSCAVSLSFPFVRNYLSFLFSFASFCLVNSVWTTTRQSRQLAEKAVNAFQDVFNKHFVDALLREAKAAASKALPEERNFNKGQSRKQLLRKKLTADNQRKQAQLQIDETIKSLAAALYAGNVAELLVEEMNKRERQKDATKVALTINRRQQEDLKAQERAIRNNGLLFFFLPPL